MLRFGTGMLPWLFDRDAMIAFGTKQAPVFTNAQPWPHLIVDDFLGPHAAAVADAFPDAAHPGWRKTAYAEQARLGQLQRTNFDGIGDPLRWLLAELGGMAFVGLLNALLGRRDLIADPHFTGAGLMATERGGHLGIHIDFNRDSHRKLDRVASILYYATHTWEPAWGGELELWDRGRQACQVRIAPVPDRLVVLAYGEDHWHGHPAPLACPHGVLRAAVAAHFYAARSTGDEPAHGAIW